MKEKTELPVGGGSASLLSAEDGTSRSDEREGGVSLRSAIPDHGSPTMPIPIIGSAAARNGIFGC